MILKQISTGYLIKGSNILLTLVFFKVTIAILKIFSLTMKSQWNRSGWEYHLGTYIGKTSNAVNIAKCMTQFISQVNYMNSVSK